MVRVFSVHSTELSLVVIKLTFQSSTTHKKHRAKRQRAVNILYENVEICVNRTIKSYAQMIAKLFSQIVNNKMLKLSEHTQHTQKISSPTVVFFHDFLTATQEFARYTTQNNTPQRTEKHTKKENISTEQ